jgi:alpha-methylacyl-CoA racemase
MGGIGPGPHGAMMLADMGADILRIDRPDPMWAALESKYHVMHRGRPAVSIDLTKPGGIDAVLKLVEAADALIEGFRPGVMEKLGLGPEVCLERNPRLVYGRITGWGQEGPLAKAAGHDINYISLVGALHAIGSRTEGPIPPLNLIGDFGGGGMLLAYGVVCGLYEAQRSGQGQVVDAAMVDGSAGLMAMFYGFLAGGRWVDERGVNALDGGAHYYNTYETADGKWISVGSIEPKFYALLLEHTGIDDPEFQEQMNHEKWPEFKERIAAVFKTKTRDEWCAIMEGTDVCFAPVLSLDEVTNHPHNVAREAFVEVEGVPQPAPAPRFSRTRSEVQSPPPGPGEHTESALLDWGFSREEIESLETAGTI